MANLFADFFKPIANGQAKIVGASTFGTGGATTAATAPGVQPIDFSKVTVTPAQRAASQAPIPGASAPAAAPAPAMGGAMPGRPVTLPNGKQVSIDEGGNIMGAPSQFYIDTSKGATSDMLGNRATSGDLQNTYASYVNKLSEAYKPSAEYIAAYQRSKELEADRLKLKGDLTTGAAPGDTQGFAEGFTNRQDMGASVQKGYADIALQTQQMIREGNIAGAEALVKAAAPQGLSYGQVLADPITGQPIAQGNTQPSYSAQASPFGGYLVFDQRTGAYRMVTPDMAAGNDGSGGGAGGGMNIPTFLQPAIGNIGGVQYIDSGKISSAQLPYAQQVAAQNNIPLLTEEDVNKLQEAQSSFGGASELVNTIATNGLNLIYAETIPQALAQRATLEARALIPGTQEKYFKDTVGSFISLITRAAGEKGVLTTGDVERIRLALPNFSDTRAVAQQKATQLQSVLNSTMQGALSAYLGTPTNASQQQSNTGGGMNAYAW